MVKDEVEVVGVVVSRLEYPFYDPPPPHQKVYVHWEGCT